MEAHAFGAALHVRYDPAQTGPQDLQQRFMQAGLLSLRYEQIAPTLEDVFLAVVEAK